MLHSILRHLLLLIGRILSKLIFKLTITGQEHLPPANNGPLLIISNHFSWFEPFLLGIHLRQYNIRFYAAAELKEKVLFRPILYTFHPILVHRGQVDRRALREAIQTLESGGTVAIFPEGGIDPDLRDRINRGEMVHEVQGHMSRESAQLIDARPGAAYLAVRTQTPILPVAFLGTEQTLNNLRRGRRTAVSMTIGPLFGPYPPLPKTTKHQRRQHLDQLADNMMCQLAALLPPAHRGPYQ